GLLASAVAIPSRRKGLASPEDLGDREDQLAPRDVGTDDDRLDDVADADALAGALAADEAAGDVDVPPVVHQVLVADQALDQVGLKLYEQAEVRDPGDDAEELLAELLAEQ